MPPSISIKKKKLKMASKSLPPSKSLRNWGTTFVIMVTTLTAYNAFHEGGSSDIQCIIRLVTDIEAMTEFKHSLKWYRLYHKNRGIL